MDLSELVATIASEPDAFWDADVYREAAEQLRKRPDLTSLALGPKHPARSLDQIISLTFPEDPRYRYQHVEYLLDQAADLLDRGVRDRTQWDELYEKWFRNALEVHELLAIVDVQDQEDKAGLFEVQHALSAGEEAANSASIEKLKVVAQKISEIESKYLSQSQRDFLANRRAVLNIMGAIGSGHANEIHGPFQGIPKNPMQSVVCDVTLEIAYKELEKELAAFETQGAATDASLVIAQKKAEGLKSKAAFEKDNVGLQKRRRRISRNLAAAKQLATILDGGALNFVARMEPVQIRYENDFREALAKIKAAALGLKLLYGYTEKLPDPKATADNRFFDECLTWVRAAISFLVRFQRLDQAYVSAFSLKRLCGADWVRQLAAGTLTFELREIDFPHQLKQRHVRLRGFSAFACGEGAKGTWPVQVVAPRNSVCSHLNGDQPVLDQTSAAPCLAGRVSGRGVLSQPDVHGTIEFFNLSPFGSWEIRVPSNSVEGIERAKIDDIHLDLQLTSRVLG